MSFSSFFIGEREGDMTILTLQYLEKTSKITNYCSADICIKIRIFFFFDFLAKILLNISTLFENTLQNEKKIIAF